MQWEMTNGTIVTPDKVIKKGFIDIKNGIINEVGRAHKKDDFNILIDIEDLMVFPGIIDAHDHLLGTYLPRVGDRRPYMNWLMWDNDLKASPIYAERQQIESSELYLLGGYRHLLSGVTSVQDHIPHFVQDMFKKECPIKIIDQFSLEHSVGSFALSWGKGIDAEYREAVEKNQPFIIHCSEGFDQETLDAVKTLDKHNALSNHTVLIHGIAFSDEDIDLLAEKNVNVVWCPVSNLYMFEQTARVKELIERGINVCLGTDSPMSGSVNVFEEMFIAKQYYQNHYNEELSNKDIVNMLTVNPAKALFLDKRGRLEQDMAADLIVINGDSSDPYGSFVNMNFENIMLVVIDGMPKYADESFIKLFDELNIPFQKVKVAGSKKIIDGDILGLLDRVRKAVQFKKELAFMPIEKW